MGKSFVAASPSGEASGLGLEEVSMINREVAKIDILVGKVRYHIEKLREYRTALISAAVTGKIDVREEV